MNGPMYRGLEGASVQSSVPLPGLFHRIPNQRYRDKVAEIVLDIRREYGLTQEDLAERLGVSESTIANAEKRQGNLDAVTMLNLGTLFGGAERLRPIIALVNGNPDKPLSPAERIKRAQREIDAALGEMEAV